MKIIMKKCTSNISSDTAMVEGLDDGQLMSGLEAHADPDWWKYRNRYDNIPHLKRWGAVLRREARKRGLL